jgi:hypothetical protein
MQTPRYAMRMTAAVGALAVSMCATPIFAVDVLDDPVQIDDRAAQLLQTSNSLCWEMFRFHQQQPDYRAAYRAAKDIWSRAGELRDALRTGPVETEALAQQVTQMNETFAQLEKTLQKWGDGDRSLVPVAVGGPRSVVTSGVEVDLPLLGVRVGGPRYVVTDDGAPPLERLKLHPNSPGSRRSLERQLAAVKVALTYLQEDAGMAADSSAPAPDSGAAAATGPVPQPAESDTKLGDPQEVTPTSTNRPGPTPARK